MPPTNTTSYLSPEEIAAEVIFYTSQTFPTYFVALSDLKKDIIYISLIHFFLARFMIFGKLSLVLPLIK
jgi:hypothetical protein